MTRILLIDDDEGVRRMLRMSLEGMGYAVTEARDGKEGVALFRKTAVDLVLTDLVMPEKEGLETILELRKAQPHLKIIAMSGGNRSNAGDNLKMARSFGAAAVLSKPFSNAVLAASIAKALGGPPSDLAGKVIEPE